MVYFVLSSISLLLIAVTMLARANDLRCHNGLVWKARLVGFIMVGAASFAIPVHEFSTGQYPNQLQTAFRVGLMLVFMTTPYLPPWWKWISGFSGEPPKWTDDRRDSDASK